MRDGEHVAGVDTGGVQLIKEFFLITNIQRRDGAGDDVSAAENNVPVQHAHFWE